MNTRERILAALARCEPDVPLSGRTPKHWGEGVLSDQQVREDVEIATPKELMELLRERKPATDEEATAAWMRTPSWRGDRPDYFIAGWEAAERFHGIKGAEGGHADVAHGREGERL